MCAPCERKQRKNYALGGSAPCGLCNGGLLQRCIMCHQRVVPTLTPVPAPATPARCTPLKEIKKEIRPEAGIKENLKRQALITATPCRLARLRSDAALHHVKKHDAFWQSSSASTDWQCPAGACRRAHVCGGASLHASPAVKQHKQHLDADSSSCSSDR